MSFKIFIYEKSTLFLNTWVKENSVENLKKYGPHLIKGTTK